MNTQSDISDVEVDRLFAGRSATSPQGEPVAEFVGALAEAYPEPSTASLESAHVAAMLAAAQTSPAAAPVVARPAWGARLRAHKLAAAVSVCLATLLAYGGAAYAGVLPDPLQSATSQLAGDVGISIPRTSSLGPGGQSGAHRNNPTGTDAGLHRGLTKRGVSAPGAGETTPTAGAAAGQANAAQRKAAAAAAAAAAKQKAAAQKAAARKKAAAKKAAVKKKRSSSSSSSSSTRSTQSAAPSSGAAAKGGQK